MRRFLTALILLLALSITNGQAAERYTGQCRGTSGPVTQCVVTVYDAGTVDVSSLFTETSLSTPKANPFTAATTDGTATPGAGNWYVFTLTLSSTTVSLYLNDGSATTNTVTAESATGNHRLGISKVNGSPWIAKMGWVWVYSDALSGAEKTTNYNCLKANIGRGISLP